MPSKMKYAFFIACKYTGDLATLKRCVQSIKKQHADPTIYVIDSDSTDLSYVDEIEKLGATVVLAQNKNYSTGMIWYAYKNYPDLDYYYFLHDSMYVAINLDSCLNHDVATISFFNSHKGVHRSRAGREYGFSNIEQIEWCDKMLRTYTPYSVPDLFTGVAFSVFFCKRHILELLDSRGMSKILPLIKTNDQAMERAWGIALEAEGFSLREKTFRHSKGVVKTFKGRH